MKLLRNPVFWLFSLAFVYVVATGRLDRSPRQQDPRELDAVLPRLAQLALAGGDRYLAGNLATIRALIADPNRMTPDQVGLLARVHEDAAWFNPANEDNYYVAGNILPWKGQFDAGQRILKLAMDARPFDWLPVFYYAFDIWYFDKDGLRAGQTLKQAVPRAKEESDRLLLETLAVRWMERGYDTVSAIRMVQGMAAASRQSRLRDYYQKRVQRLEGLLVLEKAAAQHRERTREPLSDLNELVREGLIGALPVDPFGLGYDVDKNGRPVLLNSPRKEVK